MKRYFLSFILIAALFAVMFASCDNIVVTDEVPKGQVAVNLNADIKPVSTRVANNQWETTDEVGLYMKKTGQSLTTVGAVYSNANNVKMSITGQTLTSNPPVMYPTSGNVDFVAYYPYTASVGNNYTIAINVAGQEAGLPVEVLYSNNITNQAPTEIPVTLNFQYSLAKIELTVTSGLNSKLTVTDFANMYVSVENMYTQANFSLNHGGFSDRQEKKSFTLHKKTSDAFSATFEALILPSWYANESATFLFHVGNNTYQYIQTTNYSASNLYKYNFELDFSDILEPTAILLNATITPRTENTENISLCATWTKKADFLGTSRRDAVGFSIGNKGYIGIGSNLNGSGSLKDFWEYDPVSNIWTQKADFSGIERWEAVGFSIGDKGYIGFGTSPVDEWFVNPQDFWEYDPVSNTWTKKADFPGLGRRSAVGFSIGNKGYIGTGQNPGAPDLNDFWEYDPVSNVWSQKADFAGSVRVNAVGFSIYNKGYIGTGWKIEGGSSSDCLNDFWEYDPISNVWSQKADFASSGRVMAVGFSIDNKGYIGTGNTNPGALKDFWEYDPISNNWTQKADFGCGIWDAVGFSIGNKGYIGTGQTIYEYWPSIFLEFTP